MKTDFKQFVLTHLDVENKTQFYEKNKNNPLIKSLKKSDLNFLNIIYEIYLNPIKYKVSNYVFYENDLGVYRIESLGLVFLASNQSGILVCNYKEKSNFLNNIVNENRFAPVIEFKDSFVNFKNDIGSFEVYFKTEYRKLFSNSDKIIRNVNVFFSAIKEALYRLKKYFSFFTKKQSDYSVLRHKKASLDFCRSKAQNELKECIKVINYLKLYETPYQICKLIEYLAFQLRKINKYFFENSIYAETISNFLLELQEVREGLIQENRMLETHLKTNGVNNEVPTKQIDIPNEFISEDGYKLFEAIIKALGLNDNPIMNGSKSMFNAVWRCIGNKGVVFKYSINKNSYVDFINKRYSLNLKSRSLSSGHSYEEEIEKIVNNYKKQSF